MAAALVNEARPEDAVAADERIRADLARLLQARLVRESRLGVWVHPFLIAVIVTLAWPDAPQLTSMVWGASGHASVTMTAMRKGCTQTPSLLSRTSRACRRRARSARMRSSAATASSGRASFTRAAAMTAYMVRYDWKTD